MIVIVPVVFLAGVSAAFFYKWKCARFVERCSDQQGGKAVLFSIALNRELYNPSVTDNSPFACWVEKLDPTSELTTILFNHTKFSRLVIEKSGISKR